MTSQKFRAMALAAAAVAAVGVSTVAVTGASTAGAAAQVAAVPRPDHVVVVIEENHSDSAIIGNAAAPYINSLAPTGAELTQMYAETHPSQPNYVAFFSGSTQGLTDDSCPHAYSVPNLGSELLASGAGFVGYSEGLPSTNPTTCVSGRYARKHNPWSDFTNVPASANQPFSAFPTDYTTLPAVSFVIPNLDNDMHDGTIAQGDTWLKTNLDRYAQWARTHNSLLVVTFDEDDGSEANRIPTLIVGQGIAPGTYDEHVNHYNLLRTLEDAYGLAPVGASATASPLLDIWQGSAGTAPTAAFTSSCAGLACSFDASASADSDGTIASYSWTFGDGGTSTGRTPAHTYASAGTSQVTLTVTDNSGLTGAVTHVVATTAPGAPFVSDSFLRAVTGGLGNADTGGAWSLVGSATNFSVSAGAARLQLAKAGAQLEGYVGPAQTDADLLETVAVSKVPTGGALYLAVTPRRVSTGNSYFAKVLVNPGGGVTVRISRTVGGVETLVAGPVTVAGLTYTAGDALDVRVQAAGTTPTTLRARVWRASASEPTGWQVSGTDTTAALQAGGRVGVTTYLSSAATNAPMTFTLTSVVARATSVATNHPPVAAFTPTCSQLSCSFDATASVDADGPIAAYNWTFGDSATGSGVQPTHAYATAGTYTVTLTVIDGGGLTGSLTQTVTATSPPANQPPVALFSASCAGLTCSFDAGASYDPDDELVGWGWDFGDGAAGSGTTVTHTFARAGSFAVSLTVTDDADATNTITQMVAVGGTDNQPPLAAFTAACTALTCSFDGNTSSDPDGIVATWSWDLGDGTHASGPTVTRTYGAAGTFTVQLTVTDDGSSTATVAHTVTVTAPSAQFAADSFARTLTGGWGSAPTGGPWTVVGTASRASVTPGRATMLLPAGGQLQCYLGAVAQTSADVLTATSLDSLPVGGPVYSTVIARQVSTTTRYSAVLLVYPAGYATLRITRMVGGVETALAGPVTVPGLVPRAAQAISIRVQAFGTSPTTVRARAWPASGAEPGTWLVSATDTSAALQAKGSVGVLDYVSGALTNGPITVAYPSLTAGPITG